MRPVAALVAITLILLVGPLTGVALAAPGHGAPGRVLTADPGPDPVGDGGGLRLDLTQLAPRVVTASGPATLTVAGTLTNTGTVAAKELGIRVQRGDPLAGEGALRDALDGVAATDAVTPQFTRLPDLPPGAQVPVRLSVPLRGDPTTGLALGAPGVHELLVNVNGVPGQGARARLAAVRLLLPVLSLPPDPDRRSAGADATGTASDLTPFTMLYPISDVPRRLPTVPGEPALLTDDDLAASFASGGRLDGLVAALAQQAPVGSPVRDATCLAVDPDLVETAEAMAQGYDVRGPDGAVAPGAGAAAAGQWLADLVATARGGCVLALPYADADLVSLTRAGLGEAATAAITDGRAVLGRILGTPLVTATTWPAGGLADEPTLDRVEASGDRAVVLSAEGVEQGGSQRSTGVVPITGGPLSAVLTDPLLALAAAGPDPVTASEVGGRDVGVGDAALVANPAGTSTPLSTQDAIAALVFRTQAPVRGDGPLVLAPPHLWAAEGVGAAALLDSVAGLLDDGELVARPLGDVLSAGPAAETDAVDARYPIGPGGEEVGDAVAGTVRATAADITDLRSAALDRPGAGPSPDDVFVPLQRGVVRPMSAAFRGSPGAAEQAAAAAAGRIDELRASVRVLEPPSPYSLGTSDAPILITVANGLPVTMRVRVEIAPSAGLRVAPIGPQDIPPLGRRQVRADAQATRSGQFTVEATVRTPDGGVLGPPSRLRLRSTAYGTITVWLTGSAGVLLVVLAIRRVVRRVRGDPGRHAGPPPQPRPLQDQPQPSHPPSPLPPSPLPSAPEAAGTGPGDRAHPEQDGLTGDPFPDGATDRIPARRRRGGPRRPGPPPPRVPSP